LKTKNLVSGKKSGVRIGIGVKQDLNKKKNLRQKFKGNLGGLPWKANNKKEIENFQK